MAAAVTTILLGGCGGITVALRHGGPGADGSSGHELFQRNCQGCHSLSGPAKPRQQGGSLHGLRLPGKEITQFVAEMPKLHGPLTRVQVQTLTQYLLAIEGG